MFSLHSLAATNIVIGVDFISKGIVIVSAVIMLLAFFVGFTKGFRRISWKGAACLAALGLTVGVRAILKHFGLVVNTSILQDFGKDARAWTTVFVLLASVALVLVIYGICTKTMRPYSKWVTSNPVYIDKGWEYEDDTAEVRGEVQQRLIWKNATAPTMFGRMMGGLIAMLNVAAVIIGVLTVALIALGQVPTLSEIGVVKSLLSQPEMKVLYDFVSVNGPDLLCIFIIFFTALEGPKHGFTYSLFDFVKNLGGLLLGLLACYIPFSPWVAEGGFLSDLAPLISTFGAWVKAIPILGTMPDVVAVSGKVILALILLIVGIAIASLLKVLLAQMVLTIEEKADVKAVDNVFAVILYFLTGVILCFVLWGVLAMCGHYEWFDFSVFFNGESFAGHLYGICEALMKQILPALGV